MKISSFIILLAALLYNARASTDFVCGEYIIYGFVRNDSHLFSIYLNEKTLSEINLKIPLSKEAEIIPYDNWFISADVKILSPFNGTIGQLNSIRNIKKEIYDPLNPSKFVGLKFLKKIECLK